MEQIQQRTIAVPAQLIEELGTGVDTIGIIGKRVRVTNGAGKEDFMRFIFGIGTYDGAEGTVIHVSEDGSIFADFGDDEAIPPVGLDEATATRVHPVGNVDQDAEDLQYEVIG